jgi:hypothetical protein
VKKLFWLCFVLALAAIPAQAHVVLTDGAIGVTMHIDPDDAPMAGTPSRFIFWFKDTTGHLDPALCKGSFTIASGDRVVTTQPLFAQANSGLVSVHTFTFDKPGVYTVRVSGFPVGTVSFQPFLLEFKVRVAAGSQPSQTTGPQNWVVEHAPHLLAGLVGGALILWLGFRRPRTKRTKSR